MLRQYAKYLENLNYLSNLKKKVKTLHIIIILNLTKKNRAYAYLIDIFEKFSSRRAPPY